MMSVLILAQQAGSDWIDVLLQLGIFATFVVFAIVLILMKIGKSKEKKSDDADTSV